MLTMEFQPDVVSGMSARTSSRLLLSWTQKWSIIPCSSVSTPDLEESVIMSDFRS
ncbi:hypothetical protein BDV24DRAFT_143922 [Aspergillus arachidicola]|uniref:Uncharacterized protein n=1 Tax=Aspergillus arachidicola TaxID=656916 RepID=A0A5N6XQD7_9EURO|nr:hypothetical protein BDV24DRAFT_143922 [Aspergillus arachidicola]